MSKSRHEIECVFQTQTRRGFCIWADDSTPKDIWLPGSQITLLTPNPDRGEIIRISAPEWLLIEKGLL